MSDAATPIHSRAVAAIVDLLDRERLMTLACNRPDGWPQATTVGYLNDGLNLYFIIDQPEIRQSPGRLPRLGGHPIRKWARRRRCRRLHGRPDRRGRRS